MNNRNQAGITMIEIVMVMAVIATLAAIAYPSYSEYQRKSRRVDCQSVLFQFANAMERFYTENNSYVGAAAGGATTGAPAIFPTSCPIDPLKDGKTYYTLTISSATDASYTLLATATGTQFNDKCGNLSLNQDKVKGVTGSGVSIKECWLVDN
ncbi:type IV pilin protein [Pseudomonadota bacterium]